jgi:hypothetical protein
MSTDQFRLEPQFPDEDMPGVTEHQPGDPEIERTLARYDEDIPLSVEAVTLAGQMGRIQAKLDVELQRLEDAGKAIAQVVNGINATDQDSYSQLCERLEDNNQFLKKVDEFIEPWKKLFYRPYQSVLERQKLIVGAPTASFGNGKNRRLAFEKAVKAAADAETLRLQKEQKEREEAQRLESAVKAEELGLSEAAVETILTQPSTAPAPVATPAIWRPSGVRKIAANWQAELEQPDGMKNFWAWARKQKEMPAMFQIDGAAMNREAKTHKATLGQKYPGWRGINRGGD